jgi:hypothetical protein
VLELRDEVCIKAPPEAVLAWMKAMLEHYVDWHPDYLSCRWLSGAPVEPGDTMEVIQYLHGKKHQVRINLTEVECGRRFDYRIFPGFGGRFEVEPRGLGSVVTATIFIGVEAPVLASVIVALLHMMIGGQMKAISLHQSEEGAYLKRLPERANGDSV